MKKLLTLLAFSALLVSAETVTIQFTGTSGVSDGADYVLPYSLSINGGPSFNADCYDFFDQVTSGETWQANELTLVQAETTGQFSADPSALHDYELVGVLSTLPTTTPQNQIDLQHDLWNVFDPGTFATDAGMAAYLNTATSELPTFDFSNITYFESASGTMPAVQAFVDVSPAPEPGSIFLAGIGLIAVSYCLRRRKV